MKKSLLYVLALLIIVIGVTACGKTEEKNKNTSGKITITCTSEKEKNVGLETQNVVTYHFNEEQYVTDYSVTTTQKFDKESVYKEYKAAQEESVNSSDGDISYDLKSDDKAKTLVFTMTINEINVDDAETEEEKNNLKASSIIKTSESSGNTCTIEGIDKSDLK